MNTVHSINYRMDFILKFMLEGYFQFKIKDIVDCCLINCTIEPGIKYIFNSRSTVNYQ